MNKKCSIQKNLIIKQSNFKTWKQLAQYHYRPHTFGPIDSIFAIRHKSPPKLYKNIPVGVIVYVMPVPNNHLRNLATNNRYVNLGSASASLRMLNKELRCIARVVIHPQYRGISLASWLVRETLTKISTPLVEATAVMANINPFFEKAGMTRYNAPPTKQSIRIKEAFNYLNIPEQIFTDATQLKQTIKKLSTTKKQFITRELHHFIRHHTTQKPKNLTQLTQQTIHHLTNTPAYYLYTNQKDFLH